MASSVASEFSKLTNGPARKAALQELLPMLTTSEMRFLSENLPTFVNDFIPALPVEVVLEIAKHIDILDVFQFQRVSHDWKKCWSSSRLIDDLMKANFRSSYEACQTLSAADRKSRFDEEASLVGPLRTGKFHSTNNYPTMPPPSYDVDLDFYEPRISHWTYFDGNVAYAKGYIVFVHSLVDKTVREFVSPDRTDVIALGLGSQYLVAAVDSSTKVYIWDLATEEHSHLRLPHSRYLGYRYNITVQEDKVLFRLEGEVILHVVNGKTTALPAPVAEPQLKPLSTFFHPSQDLAVVVFGLTRHGARKALADEMVVQTYQNGSLVQCHTAKAPVIRGYELWKRSFLKDERARPVDKKGNFILAQGLDQNPDASASKPFEWSAKPRRGQEQTYIPWALLYNVYDQKLSFQVCLKPDASETARLLVDNLQDHIDPARHFWGGRCFLPFFLKPLDSKEDSFYEQKHLVAAVFKSCSQDEIHDPQEPQRSYLWPIDPLPPQLLQEGNRLTNSFDTWTGIQGIEGDGRFVVAMTPVRFVAWTLDRKIDLGNKGTPVTSTRSLDAGPEVDVDGW